LVRRISRSPWSEVYQARSLEQQEAAAVYAVKVPIAADELGLSEQMLRTEALLGRTISHPHVIAVLAHELEKTPRFLVMPLLEGVTLRSVLAAGIAVPISHVLWVGRQIAAGLAAIHEQGWLHADVKPENIHLAPSGHATLLDLGCSRPQRRPGCAWEGAFMGTLRYTAPEWLVSTSAADARSDIYSLGVVLYEALAGVAPLAYDDPRRMAAAQLEEVPRSLREHRPEAPRDVCNLVERMLAKEKLRRPASAGELTSELLRLEASALAEAWSARCEPDSRELRGAA
jgi:serine/threonine-protein kinase